MTTMKSVKLSNGCTYRYQWPWDGRTTYQPPSGKAQAISFDTETEAIPDAGMRVRIPRLALATVSSGTHSCILHPAQVADWVVKHAAAPLVMQNAQFDFWVVDQHLKDSGREDARKLWWERVHRRDLHDTLILDQLIRLAQGVGHAVYGNGDGSISRRNLAELGKDYANVKVDKQDPYRLRYGELIGRPWDDPTIDEGFWSYAIKDAIVTHMVWRKQLLAAQNLLQAVRRSFPGDISNGCEQLWGYLTEALQVQASIVLAYMTRTGILSDPEKVKAYEALVRRDLDEQVAEIKQLRPEVLVYRDECTKAGAISKRKVKEPLLPGVGREVMLTAKGKTPRMKTQELKAALSDIAGELGVQALLSEGKKRDVSTSAKAWASYLGKRSPFVHAWAKAAKKAKLLTFFDTFQEGRYIRASYNLLMRTGRCSASRPNIMQCCSADTEVLTHLGWVPFPAAVKRKGLKVAQYDPSSGEIDFTSEVEWVDQEWSEDLLTFSSDHIDLALTSDHRCLLRHRKSRKLDVFEAKDYPEDWEQLHAGVYAGGKKPWLTRDELTLAIAFQADGTWDTNSRYALDFSLKRDDKVKALKALLDTLGLEYTLKEKADREGIYRFLVAPSSVGRKLWKLLGEDKLFGSWLLSQTREDLDHFCEEVWKWDAEVERETGYASEHRRNADWVQIILALSGRRAQVRKVATSGKPSYQVDHTDDTDSSHTTNVERGTLSPPAGKVYCATVPAGFIVVRRGGKAHVTGNCPRDADFRALFVARAGHKLMTVDFSAIELRTLAAHCKNRYGWSKLAETFVSGTDPHTYTASLISGWPYAEIDRGIKDEKAACKAAEKADKPRPATPYSDARQSAKACFHPDVEVLTPAGWKRVADVTVHDQVAQYWPGVGAVEFVTPMDVTVREQQPLLRVHNESIDVRVTPDHRMLGCRYSGLPHVCFPEQMRDRLTGFWNAGRLAGDGRFQPVTETDVRQAACIQADGSFQMGTVRFCFVKQRKIDRFRTLFPGARERVDGRKVYFSVPWKPAWGRILDDDKCFNVEALLSLSEPLRAVLLEEVQHWDGYPGSSGKRFHYCSTQRKNIDAVQAVASVTGWKSSVATDPPRLPHHASLHRISVKKRDYSKGCTTIVVEPLEGLHTVHCLTVPSSFLLVRDGGKTACVGNCNFGVPGGLGSIRLAQYAQASYGVDMSVEQAAELRHKLIHDVYPELALYLADTSLDNVCWNLDLPRRRVAAAFDIEHNDPDKVQRMLRAVAKVLRGTPEKADGTPYKPRFVDRVWEGLLKLAKSTSKLEPPLRRSIEKREPSPRLERALIGGPAVTLTGRVRGGCTYTQQKNTPFQSLAADGAKHALWNLLHAGFRVLAFLHDEVLLELPSDSAEEKAREAERILNASMEAVLGGHVPSACEYRLADCWSK